MAEHVPATGLYHECDAAGARALIRNEQTGKVELLHICAADRDQVKAINAMAPAWEPCTCAEPRPPCWVCRYVAQEQEAEATTAAPAPPPRRATTWRTDSVRPGAQRARGRWRSR